MEEEKLRLVFITPFVDEEFFASVKKGLADAGRLFNVDVDFTGTKDADVEAMKRLVDRYVDDHYDGIALSLFHPTAFDSVVARAASHGVPVVAFNIDSRTEVNKRLSGVCQNLFEAGRTVGLTALPHVAQGSSVLMTMHDAGIGALNDRQAGQQEILQRKNVKWTVLVTGNEPGIAATTIRASLDQDPSITAILCTGQSDTEGAGIVAAALRGKRGIYVAGFDLSPGILKYIEDGVIDFTVDQQPYVQGFYPVLQLSLFCRYGIHPSDIDTGAAIVNKANVKIVLEANRLGYR